MDDVASSSKVQLPLPEPMSKRKLKAVDSEPESEEEWEDEDKQNSDSNEEDDEDDDGDSNSLRDSEESDLDVDAPRVAQWVDEDDLEQPGVVFGDASHGKTVNAGDIVGAVYVPSKFRDDLFYSLQETVQDSKTANDVFQGLPLISPSYRLGFLTARCAATCTTRSC